MTNYAADIPLVNVPLVGSDGRMSQIWFAFFVQLWRRTGNGMGGDGQLTIADVLSYEVTMASPATDVLGASMGLEMGVTPTVATSDPLSAEMALASAIAFTDPLAIEMTMARPSEGGALSEMLLAQISDSMAAQAPKSVTLGASPATYTATYRQTFHITGGTISAISLTRSSTSLALATTTNLIELSAGDQVTVTYTVLPTTTVLGR